MGASRSTMAVMGRAFTRTGNRIGVWLYRTLNGRISNTKKAHVLVVTTPGRRTGIPRSTCVRYLDLDGGYVVWGTGAGSPRDPDWFQNLRAVRIAEVQVGATRMQVRPREFVGAERDAVWRDVVLGQAPQVERYARRSGRTIPVAFLEPVDS